MDKSKIGRLPVEQVAISQKCPRECEDLHGKITIAPYDPEHRDFIDVQTVLKKTRLQGTVCASGPKIKTQFPPRCRLLKTVTLQPNMAAEIPVETEIWNGTAYEKAHLCKNPEAAIYLNEVIPQGRKSCS